MQGTILVKCKCPNIGKIFHANNGREIPDANKLDPLLFCYWEIFMPDCIKPVSRKESMNTVKNKLFDK